MRSHIWVGKGFEMREIDDIKVMFKSVAEA